MKTVRSSTLLERYTLTPCIAAHWRKAEGPLAAALKDNVTTSITLGFKMIAGLAVSVVAFGSTFVVKLILHDS
jgi:hypothetical protein